MERRHRPSVIRLGLLVFLIAAALVAVYISRSTHDHGTQPARITITPQDNAADVLLDNRVRVSASDGTLVEVVVTADRGKPLAGKFNADKTHWTARGSLVPDAVYRVDAVAQDSDGERTTTRQTFSTVRPARVLNAEVTPEAGSAVGVAMPVAVKFSESIKNKATVQKRLQVETSKRVKGAWSWVSDREVHYRPRTYWPANLSVTVKASLRDVNSGNDAWGTEDIVHAFTITNSVITKVDLVAHQAKVYIDGKLARTIPVTGGKPGWDTRSGTKVILDKEVDKVFTNDMIGAPESYRLVSPWALRVTISGEFLHTASWSVGSQGSSNVSHGCVGMNSENSEWLYNVSHIGDPVEFKSPTGDPMELDNGYGDWNVPWSTWVTGRAVGH